MCACSFDVLLTNIVQEENVIRFVERKTIVNRQALFWL